VLEEKKCPRCGGVMEKRQVKIKIKKSPEEEIEDTAYVCTSCEGAFIPYSIFGVR